MTLRGLGCLMGTHSTYLSPGLQTTENRLFLTCPLLSFYEIPSLSVILFHHPTTYWLQVPPYILNFSLPQVSSWGILTGWRPWYSRVFHYNHWPLRVLRRKETHETNTRNNHCQVFIHEHKCEARLHRRHSKQILLSMFTNNNNNKVCINTFTTGDKMCENAGNKRWSQRGRYQSLQTLPALGHWPL